MRTDMAEIRDNNVHLGKIRESPVSQFRGTFHVDRELSDDALGLRMQ
jgi:hypothetical protein